jgi:hypothetical protein
MKELSSTPSMWERTKKRQRLMLLTEAETARWPSTTRQTKKRRSPRRAVASPLLKAHWVLQDWEQQQRLPEEAEIRVAADVGARIVLLPDDQEDHDLEEASHQKELPNSNKPQRLLY